MKRLLLLVLVGLAVAPCLRAESLGDVAKREAERRKKVEESGKGSSQVIGNTELWNNKGAIANDSSASPAVAADSPSVTSNSPTESSGNAGASKKKNEEALAGWAANGAILQGRIADAEKAVAAAKGAPLANTGATGTTYVDGRGNYAGWRAGDADYMGAKREHEAAVAEAQARLAAARKAFDDYEFEARRKGVPPGVLRGQAH
jgi:hypothetical protein